MFRALFLLLVFLGAGTTLPGPDALLHHWDRPNPAEQGVHVEPAGGCASHAGHCALGRAATGAGAAVAYGPEVRTRTPDGTAAVAVVTVVVRAALRGITPPTRAPPHIAG